MSGRKDRGDSHWSRLFTDQPKYDSDNLLAEQTIGTETNVDSWMTRPRLAPQLKTDTLSHTWKILRTEKD